MKHTYILLLLLVCCTWISCGSDNDTKKFEVKMSATALAQEKEYTLKEFAASTEEITVETTQPSWLTIDYYRDDNDQLVIVVTLDENLETAERQHQVIVKAQGGSQLYLDITQAGCEFYEESLEFSAKSQSKTITLDNFTPPVVSTEGLTDWLQMVWKSETSKDVTITAKANDGDAERTANITLIDSKGNHTTLSVKQLFFSDDSDSTSDETTDQPAL